MTVGSRAQQPTKRGQAPFSFQISQHQNRAHFPLSTSRHQPGFTSAKWIVIPAALPLNPVPLGLLQVRFQVLQQLLLNKTRNLGVGDQGRQLLAFLGCLLARPVYGARASASKQPWPGRSTKICTVPLARLWFARSRAKRPHVPGDSVAGPALRRALRPKERLEWLAYDQREEHEQGPKQPQAGETINQSKKLWSSGPTARTARVRTEGAMGAMSCHRTVFSWCRGLRINFGPFDVKPFPSSS